MVEIGEIRQENQVLKLDTKGKKILSLLTSDARISLSEISNKVGLSKSNVSLRISKLEKSGLIRGYHAFIDVSKLGLITTIVLLKTKTTHKQREEYFSRLSKEKAVYTINEIIGDFDIIVGIYSRDEKEKDVILETILQEDFIVNFDICDVKTEFPQISYTESMFAKLNDNLPIFDEDFVELDNKDKKILLSLSKDCRTFSINLAEELKLPRATVTYRIKRLIRSGVIKKFQPTVNFFMLGEEFYFLRFRLSRPSKKENLIKYLSSTLRANTILRSDGSYQVMAFLHFKDNSEFRKFEEEALAKFQEAIQDYSFSIAKSQYKLDWFPQSL